MPQTSGFQTDELSDDNIMPSFGIITALPLEYVAVQALLENTKEFSVAGTGAGRRYLLGKLPSSDGGEHVIVLALLPDMGNNSAAARSTLLLHHFPSIYAIMMVGIAGGVPHPERASEHVRLGDVVISNRNGVIQYDYIKEEFIEISYRYPPRPPSPLLLEGVQQIEVSFRNKLYPWSKYIKSASRQLGVIRPRAETDYLASTNDPTKYIPHPRDKYRRRGEPRIFTGPIAAANILLKNAVKREQLRDQFGVKAVEMEGSGIADATWFAGAGYLVVRGICDYCDSRKGDDWQEYAAIAAAAVSRALLEAIPSQISTPTGRRQLHKGDEHVAELSEAASNTNIVADEVVPPSQSKGSPRHNLPPRDYERFVGRQKELEDIKKLLLPYPQSRHHLVTIAGIGGIGKSTLALEAAYSYVDNYDTLPEAERFEAIVWVSAKRAYLTADGILRQPQAFRTLEDLFVAIARVLDHPAITRARAEDQQAVVEHILREQRTLLILDNLEIVDDEVLLIFLRFLPDPTKAIVTTRHRIDVAYPVQLLGMPLPDALRMINQETVRKNVLLKPSEQEDLYTRTGGVPLAIVWSIGLMGQGSSIKSVLGRLQGHGDIARFCFDESVAQIQGKESYHLLLALSLFVSEARRDALGYVTKLDDDDARRDEGLAELLRLSLVTKEGERFGLLPLTREYVSVEAAKHLEWVEEARKRWQTYFFNFVQSNGSSSHYWRGYNSIEDDLANILAVPRWIAENLRYYETNDGLVEITPASVPQAKILIDLMYLLSLTCRIRGYWREYEDLCHLVIQVSRAIDDTYSIGWRYFDLNWISYHRGDINAAEHWAIEMRVAGIKGGHQKLVCHADRLLGLVALRRHNLQEASDLLTSALRDYQQLGGQNSIPTFASSLGDLAEQQGNLGAAQSWYLQAVSSFRFYNHLPYLAFNLLSLAKVTLALGDRDGAAGLYNESLDVARECGRVDVIAKALYNSAKLLYDMGHREPARTKVREAFNLFRRLGMDYEQDESMKLLEEIDLANGSDII